MLYGITNNHYSKIGTNNYIVELKGMYSHYVSKLIIHLKNVDSASTKNVGLK